VWYLDDWHDFLRLGVFVISIYAFVMLIVRWRQYADEWTDKTKDYWYALLMWTFVGIVGSIQGIIMDRPLTPATVVLTAAVLVTGRGLHTKGAWGGEDA
jgi:hypothetical protein